MKKHLFSLAVACLLSVSCVAQWVAIPDTIFGNYLNITYPQCMQGGNNIGWEIDTTCNAIISEDFLQINFGPYNLDGIQYFDSLQILDCSQSHLTSVPSLPRLLVEFNCSINWLTTLPDLPASLKVLNCFGNLLTSLPVLPDSLNFLRCDGNDLTSLPPLPNTLTILLCRINQLTVLPALPGSLTLLGCDRNQLQSIPDLPDSLDWFTCNNNPINCFPKLPIILNFEFDSTNVTCLPNYPLGNINSEPPLNNVPLCDSANINGCPYCRAHFSVYPDNAVPGLYYGFNQSYGSNITSYLWEFGDGDTSTLQYPSHTYAQPGQYYVCLTVGSANCSNTYCDSSFLVFKTEGGLMSQLNIFTPTTAVTAISQPSTAIHIYPNPTSGSFAVSVSENLIGKQLIVTDATGRVVFQSKISNLKSEISVSNMSAGIYLVRVGNVVKRLVVE